MTTRLLLDCGTLKPVWASGGLEKSSDEEHRITSSLTYPGTLLGLNAGCGGQPEALRPECGVRNGSERRWARRSTGGSRSR